MKTLSKYFWLFLTLLVVIHGASVIHEEWQRKSIHDHGETVEIKIEELNCPKGVMTFHFETIQYEKNIDARTCVLFNKGQKIKLKHSQRYPEMFLFVNEKSPSRFIVGTLEIALGIIGLLANWPLFNFRRVTDKNFRTVV